MCVCVCVYAQSCSTVTPWTLADQIPLCLEFSRQKYWNGLPFPTAGDLPNPGIEPTSLTSPALAADSLPLFHLEKRIPSDCQLILPFEPWISALQFGAWSPKFITSSVLFLLRINPVSCLRSKNLAAHVLNVGRFSTYVPPFFPYVTLPSIFKFWASPGPMK